MNRLKSFRKRCETVFTRFALWFIPNRSRRTIVVLSRCAGRIAYYLPFRLRKVALANLDIVYGARKTDREKRAILRSACQTFALVLLDIFWFSKNTRERIADYVTFDPALADLFQKKAQMCITGHLGNWELLGHAVSVSGYPLSSVATPLVNPAVDAYFARVRTVSGQIIIPRNGAVRAMLRTLKNEGKVGLLLDQNTRPEHGGLFVDFMGLPAPISDAGASLALKTGADILFGFCIPRRDGTYYVHTAPPIPPQTASGATKDEQVQVITQQIARTIEQTILAHPEAWLWMYKRWKFVPPGAERPARYPFYAETSKTA